MISLLFFSIPAFAPPIADPVPVAIRAALALSGAARGGRVPFERDAVQEALCRGAFAEPKAGGGGWTAIQADKGGVFQNLRAAYVFASVEIPEAGVYLLNARGNSVVYANGELRPGDVYSYGYFPLPVSLKKGKNTFLFFAGRGTLSASLAKMTKPARLNPADPTLPDLLVGEKSALLGALPVLNGTGKPLGGLTLTATVEGGSPVVSQLPLVLPLSARKIPFSISAAPGNFSGDFPEGTRKLSLALKNARGAVLDTAELAIRVRKATDSHRRTFVSVLDGSVQYWAALPATRPDAGNALALTLHGASVEAQGQIDAYGPHDDVSLAAPTNRRPYGFDWEDWGRRDALEVLALAERYLPHDPRRVSVTGHSMGGHGTWSLASLLPGTFAAAAPSAGWISFATYGGAPPPDPANPVGAVMRLVNLPSDTLSFLPNLLSESIYVLHGDADDNVPVGEARRMRAELAGINHPDVGWHEEPGAGHWWDNDPAPGAACVDYPDLLTTLRRARISAGEGPLRFITANPAISATDRWLTVEQQVQPLVLSEANLNWQGSTVIGTTKNIRRLSIDLPNLTQLSLDGQTLTMRGRPVRLLRERDRWAPAFGAVLSTEKNPQRSGPFKQALGNHLLLVYGTRGTPAENAWSFGKARYDAEALLYRGNGAPDVIADRNLDSAKTRDRNVLLYGNADTNGAWDALLKDAPIRIRRGGVTVGGAEKVGGDLACLFVCPRSGSKDALVGVVGGTGLPGCRATDRLPYFAAGVAYPDWIVFTPDVFQSGLAGAVGAGIFGNDWRVESGQSAWR